MTADIIFIFNLTTVALPTIKAFWVRPLSCNDGDGVARIACSFSRQVLLVYSLVEPLDD